MFIKCIIYMSKSKTESKTESDMESDTERYLNVDSLTDKQKKIIDLWIEKKVFGTKYELDKNKKTHYII